MCSINSSCSAVPVTRLLRRHSSANSCSISSAVMTDPDCARSDKISKPLCGGQAPPRRKISTTCVDTLCIVMINAITTKVICKVVGQEKCVSATTSRDRQRTRSELIDATRQLIDTTGRTRFRVREICDAAGYSRGAFYSSFPSMDDHLLAVHERQNADLIDAVNAALVHATDAVGDTDDLSGLVTMFVSAIAVDRGRLALQASLNAHAQHAPDLAAQLITQRNRLRRTLEPYLLRIVECTGRELNTDLSTFVRAVMAAQTGAATQLIASDDPDDLRPLLVATTILGLSRSRRSRSS